MLELNNISFERDKKILDDISLKIERNDFISVVGESGSGKSTLLKLIGSLISPTSGEIFFNDKNYLEYDPIMLRRKITYIHQNSILFRETVRDNLEFPFLAINERIDNKRIDELMNKLHMGEFLDKNILDLSGGEKQRIAFLRGIIFLPEVILLDEITSSLDQKNKEMVDDLIYDLNKSGTTILQITHNLEQSRKNANKIIAIENGKIINMEKLQ